jgi:hypothetical protein
MEQRLKIATRIILLTIIGLLMYLMSISQEIINLNGVRGKDISRLFDGNLETNYNANSINEPLALPYESYVVLDSITNVSQFSYYTGNSSQTQGFMVRFLDKNRVQIGGYLTTPTVGKYRQWTNIQTNYMGVRFIVFQTTDPMVQWDGINEVKLSGTAISKAPSIYPTRYNFIPTDPGIFAHGINIIGDRINKTWGGDTVLLKVAKSVRFYWAGYDFDIYPQTYYGSLASSPLFLGRYGYNHSGNLLNTFKRWGIQPMMTKSGGSIKYLDSNTAKNNTAWLGNIDAKYIEPGANPETDSAWAGLSNQYQKLIGLYGTRKQSVNAINGDTTSGQSTMEVFEWDNEPNRWWQQEYYHPPRAYYHALSAVYSKGKAADAKALIYAGALPGIDTVYWKAVYFCHYLKAGLAPFPADGFNFNMYLNDGSQQREGTVGVSPERYKIREVLIQLQDFMQRHFGKPVRWTEFGYATDPESPYDVPDQITQANYTLRLKAVAQSVRFLEKMYYYSFWQDNTPPFNSMAMFRDTSAWHLVIPKPVAYATSNELYIERNAPWFSELVKNGGDTGVWVTKKENLYKIWKASGSASYTLPGPAKIYKLRYDRWLPDSTTGQTITASEAMTWAEVQSITPPPIEECKRTIKAIIKTEYRDSATNKLIRTATATIYLR